MNILDVRTVMVNVILASLVCMLVMYSLWRQYRKRFPALNYWLVNFFMLFLSVLFMTLRGNLPDFVSIVLANALMIGGMILMYIGLGKILGVNSPQTHNIILLALFIAAQTFFTYGQSNLTARILLFSTALLFMTTQCAWLIFRKIDIGKVSGARAIGWIFILYSLTTIARIVGTLMVPQNQDFFSMSWIDSLVLISYEMMYTILAFTMYHMVNRHLFNELEHDISERKHTETALKISQEKFAAVFQNIPDVILITSMADGKIIDVNESFFTVTGYSREEIDGKTSIELGLWEYPAERQSLTEQLKQHGRVLNFEMHARVKSGATIVGLMSCELIHFQDETWVLNVFHDISDRIMMEEALKLEKALSDGIFASVPGLVYLYDEQGRLLRWNPQFETITGYSSAELDLFHFLDWFKHDPKEVEKVTLGVQKALTEGFVRDEAWISIKNGSKILFDLTAARLELGGKVYFTGLGTDITERRKMEDQAQQGKIELQRLLVEAERSRAALLSVVEDQKEAEDRIRQLNRELERRVADRTTQLQASNRELEAFAYSVSHDLRAPLRAIDGFSRIMQQEYDQQLDEEGKRLLRVIRDSTAKMDQLITDLLALSRASRRQFSVSPIDMTALAASVYYEIAPPEIQEKFTFKIDPLPSISGDPTLMHQVWTNLIANAIKYTSPMKDCKIEISGYEQVGECVFVIKDNGVGYNPKYKEKLFGLFQRLHKDAEFEGSGVGLAIVQRIIHRHGGEIWSESEVGQGATFFFSIPKSRGNHANI